MVNGKNKTADTVLYEKNIGEKSYYVVQAIPDTKAKTLYIVTAFIGKKGYKKEASQLINAKSLDATAKTESANASANMVSQDPNSVKRYQERDSEGNTLSKEQQEFFKDSKIRDKNGNLLVVRHGTNTDFNIFDFSMSGKNGKAEGYGFYFSDDPEITNRYGGIQKEVYLNITKPLYNNKRTIKKADVVKLTNALIDFDIEKWKSDGLTWQDSFISNYIMTYGMPRQSAVLSVRHAPCW